MTMPEHTRKGATPLSTAASKMGKAGGPARAKALSRQERTEIAREGAEAKNKGTAHQRGQKGGKRK